MWREILKSDSVWYRHERWDLSSLIPVQADLLGNAAAFRLMEGASGQEGEITSWN